jgi:hypothetical protein
MKTPQMYLLWLTLFGNTIAGVTLISAAKTMMTDVFGGAYPAVVNGAFAASFVMGKEQKKREIIFQIPF